MKSKYTRINLILILFFIISMIYTTLQLFSLQDELILGVSALTTDDILELSSVLNNLYITVALSLVIGLVAIFLNYKTDRGVDGPQLTSSSNRNKSETSKAEEAVNISSTDMDMSDIQKAIKNNNDKKDRYTSVLAAICNKMEVGQGAIYLTKENKDQRTAELYTSYALHIPETETLSFAFGEGLIGQVAVEGSTLNIDDIPENYVNIVSGLGSASPKHLLVTPLTKNKKIVGVIELASFTSFSSQQEQWVNESLNLLVNTATKKIATEAAPKKDKKNNKNE